jgi:hypothetical protein
MCPFTTCALHSLFLMRATFANKQNSITEGWGLSAQCFCVEPEFSPCVHLKKIHTNINFIFLRRLKINRKAKRAGKKGAL